MRKSSLYILSAILLFILCGITLTNSFQSEQRKLEQQQDGARPRELNFIHWTYFPDEVFTLFEQENPDIKVNYTRYVKNGYSQMQRQLLLSGEKVDMMGVLNEDYQRLAAEGTLIDLSGKALLNYYEDGVRQTVRRMYDGREYGVALRSAYYGIWYNKIFFDQYNLGVPDTYGELLWACAMFKANNISPIVIGARDEEAAGTLLLLPLFDIMDETSWQNRYRLGIDSFETAASDLLSKTESLIEEDYIDPESINLTSQQAFEYFKKGKVAMIITSDQSLSLTGEDMEKVCDPGVFRIPYSNHAADMKTPVMLAQDLIAVHAGSDMAEEAQLFLEYISRPEIARIICKATSAYPTVKNVDTSYLRYNELWAPLRSGECAETDIFELSEENRKRLFDDCQSFLIGEIDTTKLVSDIESCMIIRQY